MSAVKLIPLPDLSALQSISAALVESINAHMQMADGATMLPSFTYSLAPRQPSGTAICIDLGGSTLRIAVLRLPRTFLERRTWVLEDAEKQLRGTEFFDYVAERVAEVAVLPEAQGVWQLGLAWSFPVV